MMSLSLLLLAAEFQYPQVQQLLGHSSPHSTPESLQLWVSHLLKVLIFLEVVRLRIILLRLVHLVLLSFSMVRHHHHHLLGMILEGRRLFASLLVVLLAGLHVVVLVLEEEIRSFLPPSRWIQSLSSRRDSSVKDN